MDLSILSADQQLLFFSAFVMLLGSCLAFYRKSEKFSLALLFVACLIIGFFVSLLDPFLNIWDEQVHAMVAKNIAEHSIIPSLYHEELIPMNYEFWVETGVWLHKPPLFLWQMGLSIKLFGANEIAVRIPSILMHAILPLFVYRIGKLSINAQSGFIAAVLMAFAYFPLELLSGAQASDHNDVAFLFYVLASFWAWFEYLEKRTFKWLILIAIFSAGAVLNKWAMGFLVYVIWGLSVLIDQPKKLIQLPFLKDISIAFFITLIIVIPWHLYCYFNYPTEYLFESSMNGKRLWEAVEAHRGDFFYHFSEGIPYIYGKGILTSVLLFFSVVLLPISAKTKIQKIAFPTLILFIYTFFSIAATKMLAYTLIAMPFILLGIASVIDLILNRLSSIQTLKKVSIPINIIVVVISAFFFFDLEKTLYQHGFMDGTPTMGREQKLSELKFIEYVKNNYNENHVILNADYISVSQLPVMFYTGVTAFEKKMEKEFVEIFKSKNKKIVVLDKDSIPDHIRQDPEIIMLDRTSFE